MTRGSGVDDDADLLPIPSISDLPDDWLAYIFKLLDSLDRKRCSLVCGHWLLIIEDHSPYCLSLDAKSILLPILPSPFTGFDAITTLVLEFDKQVISIIADDALIIIALYCPNLTGLKLRYCLQLTDRGMAAFAVTCKKLKNLSCQFCYFSAKGINAVLNYSSSLEQLSLVCLSRFLKGVEKIQIIGSKNLKLRSLKICCCVGNWDRFLKPILERVTRLEKLKLGFNSRITDADLSAISINCSNLKILHLAINDKYTNAGLVSIADHCKLLRTLHIYQQGKNDQIGEEGLIAIAKGCPNLEYLILRGVNPTCLSLGFFATNCHNLESLKLSWNDKMGDAEISCIASQWMALKYLTISYCPAITDRGLEAFSVSYPPNLVRVNFWGCTGITRRLWPLQLLYINNPYFL